jgi:2-keto-4-pentenoate hydratase/2-oxohepta-3-ene-1,7-dioic acid hydratase in catechol pathway
MKIANLAGRLVLIRGVGAVDVAGIGEGRFGSDPQAIYPRWDEFRDLVADRLEDSVARPYDPRELLAPVPAPRQLFAMGFNYQAHADEFGTVADGHLPLIFTKFAGSIASPYGTITLSRGSVDWEVELVVAIGRLARDIDPAQAWDYIAGVTVGQDISERETQLGGRTPQSPIRASPRWGPGWSHRTSWITLTTCASRVS